MLKYKTQYIYILLPSNITMTVMLCPTVLCFLIRVSGLIKADKTFSECGFTGSL